MKPFPLLNSKGVTLVELLAVVAIIAVLSSIALTSFQGVGEAAKQARAERNVSLLNEAIERFMAQGGDITQVLSSSSPETALVNTLRSSDAGVIRMGGPFIDSAMGPEMSSEGWRAVLINRVIDGNMQVYFNTSENPADGPGIVAFRPSLIPAGFTPVGVPAVLVGGTQMTAAPALPTWGAPNANPAVVPNATPSMVSYY